MKQETLLRFKTTFNQLRDNLLYAGTVVNEEFQIQKDETYDEVDMTSTELETGMRMRLRSRETLFLKKIDEALRKIAAGTFGLCEACNEEIDLRRLEARPTATLCVHCKEEEERSEQIHIDGHRFKSLGRKLRLA